MPKNWRLCVTLRLLVYRLQVEMSPRWHRAIGLMKVSRLLDYRRHPQRPPACVWGVKCGAYGEGDDTSQDETDSQAIGFWTFAHCQHVLWTSVMVSYSSNVELEVSVAEKKGDIWVEFIYLVFLNQQMKVDIRLKTTWFCFSRHFCSLFGHYISPLAHVLLKSYISMQ